VENVTESLAGLNIYLPRLLTTKEYFSAGHRACVGCGEALAVRLACKALGRNIIIINATGCMEIVSSQIPQTNWEVPWMHVLFENTAAVASGAEAGLKALKRVGKYTKETKIVAMAGDGGTADIGLQALSGALERGHDLMYICFDNEAYMNTGVQRSSSTPFGAFTTTSPAGKKSIGQSRWKKNMPAIAAAHDIPYVATATPSYPFDMIEKIKKAKNIKGPSYIHVLSVCPTGWRSPTPLAIKLGRLAVETGIFPLYEIENGKYKLTIDIKHFRPVEDYLLLQGRFRHLPKDALAHIQSRVKSEYAKLKKNVRHS
jgi:pyruvate ferredoxin oxidoreductase beta subunit